jgi:hypothetical protein
MRNPIKSILPGVVMIAAVGYVSAQDLVRVRAGEPVMKSFPDKIRLRYKDYGAGRVIFANGKVSPVYKFNYDLLLEEMLLIRPDGDTVLLFDPHAYNTVLIDNSVYFRPNNNKKSYKGPYYQIISQGKNFALAVRDAYFFRWRERRVDLGYYSYTDNTNSLVSYKNMGGNRWTPNEDTIWREFEICYIIDDAGNASRLNRGTLYKLFPAYRGLIDNYINVTRTRFYSRPEVEKLIAYCVNLDAR